VVIAGTVVAASAGINWAIVAIVGTVFLLYVGSLIAAARAKYLVGASLAQACRDQPPSICLLIGVGALVGGVAAVHFGHPHLFGSAWWAASGLGLAVISLLAVQYDVFDKRQRGGRFAVLTVLLVVLSAFVAETSVLDVAWSTEENVILVPGDFATAVLCAGALPGLIGLLIYLWARRRQVSESC
jgi:hypothetical protein